MAFSGAPLGQWDWPPARSVAGALLIPNQIWHGVVARAECKARRQQPAHISAEQARTHQENIHAVVLVKSMFVIRVLRPVHFAALLPPTKDAPSLDAS